MDATPAVICRCVVIESRIVFCPLHEQAESLLAVCEYLRKFLGSAAMAERKDEILVREIILPYLDGAIRRAGTNVK